MLDAVALLLLDGLGHDAEQLLALIGVQQRGRLIQVRFDDKERLLMADMAPMRRLAG